jgi:hypothetical protein
MPDFQDLPKQVCGYSLLQEGTGAVCCPDAEQSPEEVAAWLHDHALSGEAVVVLLRHHRLCQYRLDEFAFRRGRRIYLRENGAFDEQGLALNRPRNVILRILRPSAPVVRAAVEGWTLQHCRPVNKRPLDLREESLARRIRGA